MAHIIGIDLGSYAVKLAVMEGGFGRYEVEEYLARPVSSDDGAVPDLNDRIRVLESLLAGLTPDDRAQYTAAFPTEQSSVRMIDMPFSDKKQIEQTLEFEVEGRVPFDLDDMILSHRIVSSDAAGSQILTALTPKDAIGVLLSSLDEAEADPKSLVIDGDVLAAMGTSGLSAIVDIGHTRTLVTVCQDGAPLGTRAISLGGHSLTSALAKAHGISWADAEERKHNARLQLGSSPTEAVAEWDDSEVTEGEIPPVQSTGAGSDGEILREALQPLLAHLRATLINFEDALEVEIGTVHLAGGSAALEGLVQLLKIDLGVPVAKLRVSSAAALAGEPARFALAHALAERGASIGAANAMELRKGDFKFRGDLANVRMIALWASVAAAVLMLIGTGMFMLRVVDSNKQIDALDGLLGETVASIYEEGEEPPTFTDPDDALTQLQIRTLETTSLIDLLGAIVGPTPPTLNVLTQLSDSLPEPTSARIDVSELTINSANINIQAETDGYDAASTIEASLQEHVRFKAARKGDEKKVRDAVRFSITIPLEQDSTEVEEG